jgi:hypothetical protein
MAQQFYFLNFYCHQNYLFGIILPQGFEGNYLYGLIDLIQGKALMNF